MKGKNRLAHSFLFIRLMRAGSGAKLRSFVARRRFRETAVVAGLRARAPSPERGAMIAPFSPLVLETRLPRRGRPPARKPHSLRIAAAFPRNRSELKDAPAEACPIEAMQNS